MALAGSQCCECLRGLSTLLCWDWLGSLPPLSSPPADRSPLPRSLAVGPQYSSLGTQPILCASIPGLVPKQLRFCRNYVEIMPSVAEGIKISIEECQHQFRGRRWNCTTVNNSLAIFGPVLDKGTRGPFTAFGWRLRAGRCAAGPSSPQQQELLCLDPPQCLRCAPPGNGVSSRLAVLCRPHSRGISHMGPFLFPLPQGEIVRVQRDRLPTGTRPSGVSWRENTILFFKHREGRWGGGQQRHTSGVIQGAGARELC